MSAIHVVSEAQLAANRANAQHSTGPRTAEGKAHSSKNGWKHGLTGQTLVMTERRPRPLQKFSTQIIATLAPAGALEEDLAQSIAMDRWRLNRIKAIEQNIFAMGESADEETFLAHAKQLNLLTLYESRIGRGVERTMKELKQLQAERLSKRGTQLTNTALLYRLAEMKNLPFDREADGFGFSIPEIARHARLEEARRLQKIAQKRAA